MKTIKFFLPLLFAIVFITFYSCKKGDDPNQQLTPQKEVSSDKEKELKDKEEFL